MGQPQPPRLLHRVRGEIRTRHYSRRTEDAYVFWIRQFIVFSGKRHPRDLGASDVSRFLERLAVERRVAALTQNQALSAVLFLYRACRLNSLRSSPCRVRRHRSEFRWSSLRRKCARFWPN